MSQPDRRQVLRFAAAAAMLPALNVRAATSGASGRFVPPAAPMQYSRTLRRELADGAAMVVGRTFAVRFVPQLTGFRLDGEQVAVSVEAPAALARFADLERARHELALFPIVLDAHGVITGAPEAIDAGELDEAVRAAEARIEQAGFSIHERAEAKRFVATLHQDASKLVTALPRDLFAPAALETTAKRDLALPDGAMGEVTVRFVASTDLATGVMKQARREIVTDLSGERRRTVEEWSLTRD